MLNLAYVHGLHACVCYCLGLAGTSESETAAYSRIHARDANLSMREQVPSNVCTIKKTARPMRTRARCLSHANQTNHTNIYIHTVPPFGKVPNAPSGEGAAPASSGPANMDALKAPPPRTAAMKSSAQAKTVMDKNDLRALEKCVVLFLS